MIDPDVDPIGLELAAQVANKFPASGDPAGHICVAMDFLEAEGTQTRIGVQMADEISWSLSLHAAQLTVLDRADRAASLETARHNMIRDHAEAVALEYARSAGANLVVIGEVSKQSRILHVHLRMLDSEGQTLAEVNHQITDPRYLAFGRDKLPPRPAIAFPYWPDLPVAGKKGFEEPKCIYCPSPEYTAKARKAKIQGSMLVYLIIDPDGTVQDVVVAEGLGSGLAEEGIKAVKKWRFKPVNGPDGKPAKVQIPVDISFRVL